MGNLKNLTDNLAWCGQSQRRIAMCHSLGRRKHHPKTSAAEQLHLRQFDDETVASFLNHRVDVMLKIQCRFKINAAADAQNLATAQGLSFRDHSRSSSMFFSASDNST